MEIAFNAIGLKISSENTFSDIAANADKNGEPSVLLRKCGQAPRALLEARRGTRSLVGVIRIGDGRDFAKRLPSGFSGALRAKN